MLNISAINMPRCTEKARVQQHLDNLESAVIEEILEDEPSSDSSADYYHDLLEDISTASEHIKIKRYLIDRSKGTAGCHKSDNILEDIIERYPEAYFSRKKDYGFNLQAICNWNGKFIWARVCGMASMHDSIHLVGLWGVRFLVGFPNLR